MTVSDSTVDRLFLSQQTCQGVHHPPRCTPYAVYIPARQLGGTISEEAKMNAQDVNYIEIELNLVYSGRGSMQWPLLHYELSSCLIHPICTRNNNSINRPTVKQLATIGD
jgi:hypothetical protein